MQQLRTWLFVQSDVIAQSVEEAQQKGQRLASGQIESSLLAIKKLEEASAKVNGDVEGLSSRKASSVPPKDIESDSGS